MPESRVLVVANDAVERDRIGDWLEGDGYGVLACPGPQGPDYTCLASSGAACPLATDADVVVLDLRLMSDEVMAGMPGWELMLYYMTQGKKVVALSSLDDTIQPTTDDGVAVLPRPVSRDGVIEAVGMLAGRIKAEKVG